MGWIGKKVFISYRGSDYQVAGNLANSLLNQNSCHQVILVPPGKICVANEVLLPFEFFELMEFITDSLHDCEAFIILDAGNYWESYWTRMEVKQWQRFSKIPEVYLATLTENNQAQIQRKGVLETLNKEESKMRARISMGTNRRLLQSSRIPEAWGKFAKNCFLVPCVYCGRHFLATQNAVYASLKGKYKVFCPHCAGESKFIEGAHIGNFYRKPVLLAQKVDNARPINDSDLLTLLIAKDVPPSLGLIKLPEEVLDSDIMKVLKAYGWIVVATSIFGALVWLFSDDEDD